MKISQRQGKARSKWEGKRKEIYERGGIAAREVERRRETKKRTSRNRKVIEVPVNKYMGLTLQLFFNQNHLAIQSFSNLKNVYKVN